MEKDKSPKIVSFKWGNVVTDEGQQYKDVKLFPGGSRAWDWNETGTHHSPGIQVSDVEELLENDAKVVVLSKGVYKRLGVCSDTEEYLEREGVSYHILQTEEAVEKYNELCESTPVGALIHSTC